jgi:hypothetical protein
MLPVFTGRFAPHDWRHLRCEKLDYFGDLCIGQAADVDLCHETLVREQPPVAASRSPALTAPRIMSSAPRGDRVAVAAMLELNLR